MSSSTVIGFDLGGTKSAIGLYEATTWKELHYHQFPTDAKRGFDAVSKDVLAAIQELRDSSTTAIGIGVPGLIRQPEGIIVNAPNIPGAKNIAFKAFMQEQLDLPLYIENDARAFTLAEASLGAGKGHRIVIGITLGTGVGGGIVIDGKIFHGSEGFAGEIGHMLLRPGQPPFKTDDNRGEVEQFLSGTALGKRCEDARTPEEYLMGDVCEFMHPDLYREIAWLCTSLVHLINPSIVIFGGSAGRALEPHLGAIKTELSKWMLPHTPQPELAIAHLPHPGVLGAALATVQ